MKDFKEILEKIAKENGTTPENVNIPSFRSRVSGV